MEILHGKASAPSAGEMDLALPAPQGKTQGRPLWRHVIPYGKFKIWLIKKELKAWRVCLL